MVETHVEIVLEGRMPLRFHTGHTNTFWPQKEIRNNVLCKQVHLSSPLPPQLHVQEEMLLTGYTNEHVPHRVHGLQPASEASTEPVLHQATFTLNRKHAVCGRQGRISA